MNRLSFILPGCLLVALLVAGLAAIADGAARAQLERETHAAQLWSAGTERRG